MISAWHSSTILLVLSPLFISSGVDCTRIMLDASGVREYDNQMKLYTYKALSDLDHLATNTFRLKLNAKSLQKLNFLKNITKAGVSFNGLTDIPHFPTISKEAYKKLSNNLSEESMFLLKALSSKNLKIPLSLQPADEDIPEALSFMDAFKEYWKHVDRVAPVEIQKLNTQEIPVKVKEILEKRSYRRSNRVNRKFLVPELPLQVSEDYLEHLLTNVFIQPRDHGSNESAFEKEVIRAFITKEFEEIGLYVYNHEFSAHENHYMFGEQIHGTNVVGFLPGELWGTSKDKPLIVGAHYDTVPNTTGTVDNASGMSAVLEMARMLSSSNCNFKNSIFFVAFDLEEIGTQGSFMFVKDFLLKLLFPTYGIKSIGGAFILDCIGNWDPNNGTQAIPDPWEEKVHGLKAKMEARNSTGDFMAVMYREKPDYVLAERLQYYYDGLGSPEYRSEMMALRELKESRPNDSINMENYDFFRSDHYRFWYPSVEAPNISLSAVLITDTGPYRGKMAECYHGSCDTFEHIKPSIKFISKIARATAWAIADLAAATCGPNGVFRVPEMFLLTKEREFLEKKEPEKGERPVVTLEGVIQILRYLGRVNLKALEDSVNVQATSTLRAQKSYVSDLDDDLKATSTITDHSAVARAPVHRFSIRQRGSKKLPNINKVTITLHGENSSYLIPLHVTYPLKEPPLPQEPNSELKGHFTVRKSSNTEAGSEKSKGAHEKSGIVLETNGKSEIVPAKREIVSHKSGISTFDVR